MFGPSKRDLLRLVERERQQHRAEIANLLDRLAAAHDKPWTLPPRPFEEEREPAPDPEADELLPV